MFRRILLALEAGDAGAVALSFTVALARTNRAHVDVVHVNEFAFGRGGVGRESPDQAADIVTDALKELHAEGIDAVGMTYRTTRLDVPAAICGLARERRADAIVVGSRRRRGPGRGRTRARIARRTPLPVLTAPAPLRVKRRAHAMEGPASGALPVSRGSTSPP
jgi:nucleotide-binding universal stress UspA family protein